MAVRATRRRKAEAGRTLSGAGQALAGIGQGLEKIKESGRARREAAISERLGALDIERKGQVIQQSAEMHEFDVAIAESEALIKHYQASMKAIEAGNYPHMQRAELLSKIGGALKSVQEAHTEMSRTRKELAYAKQSEAAARSHDATTATKDARRQGLVEKDTAQTMKAGREAIAADELAQLRAARRGDITGGGTDSGAKRQLEEARMEESINSYMLTAAHEVLEDPAIAVPIQAGNKDLFAAKAVPLIVDYYNSTGSLKKFKAIQPEVLVTKTLERLMLKAFKPGQDVSSSTGRPWIEVVKSLLGAHIPDMAGKSAQPAQERDKSLVGQLEERFDREYR